MKWHVWLRNFYCGTVSGETHHEAVQVAEQTWGTAGTLHVYRVLSNTREFAAALHPRDRRLPQNA